MPTKQSLSCPACKGPAHQQPATNEDGSTLILGSFDEDPGMGLDIEDDNLRKFQCQGCKQVFFLPG